MIISLQIERSARRWWCASSRSTFSNWIIGLCVVRCCCWSHNSLAFHLLLQNLINVFFTSQAMTTYILRKCHNVYDTPKICTKFPASIQQQWPVKEIVILLPSFSNGGFGCWGDYCFCWDLRIIMVMMPHGLWVYIDDSQFGFSAHFAKIFRSYLFQFWNPHLGGVKSIQIAMLLFHSS